LKNNPNVNVIGIDRGERNLIYVSLINQKGEILEQKSFNIVASIRGDVNYHAKLAQKENERDEARKSWQTIGNIKELKEGYLSQVIHEITKMMIENNAIIVMEDLNKGFKRGRMKVEKQVYQKFEKMLIDKLQYLVFKTDNNGEPTNPTDAGGVLNGYQLSDYFDSMKNLGKQCGFIFYVPASYTSKIDPKTGFVDVFRRLQSTHVENMRDFLKNMDSINWNGKDFIFKFNYDNFKTVQNSYIKEWTLSSSGERILYSKDEGYYTYTPTKELKRLFDNNNVSYPEGKNLVENINDFDNKVVKGIYDIFQKILQIRNSGYAKSYDKTEMRNNDYIYSPAIVDGTQFDSRTDYEDKLYPIDADANGAYNIALKGLMCLRKISDYATYDGTMKESELFISVQEWLKFIQNKEYCQ
jgi:CRISPR-associated protein Cpf1